MVLRLDSMLLLEHSTFGLMLGLVYVTLMSKVPIACSISYSTCVICQSLYRTRSTYSTRYNWVLPVQSL